MGLTLSVGGTAYQILMHHRPHQRVAYKSYSKRSVQPSARKLKSSRQSSPIQRMLCKFSYNEYSRSR